MSLEIYKKEHKQGKNDAWEKYLINRYKETKTIEDRDALIDLYFNRYTVIYTKIRSKKIRREINEAEFIEELRQLFIDGIQVSVDLGLCRQLTDIEVDKFVNALKDAFGKVDTSSGQINDNIITKLCNLEIPEVELFKKFYYKELLIK